MRKRSVVTIMKLCDDILNDDGPSTAACVPFRYSRRFGRRDCARKGGGSEMAYVSTHRDSHPSCPQPETGDVYVWRYLDLARLVSIVANKKLNLSRVDKLRDEFEGSLTRGVMERYAQQYPDGEHIATLKKFREETWVSCWHENESESEAMWRLYCQPHDGVALRTTYKRLDDSLPDAIFLGQVTYVDYDDTAILPTLETLNGFGPMMHKRTAFAHEREIRAVVTDAHWAVRHQIRYLDPPPIPADAVSFAIDWDVETVIESVWVSPYAPEWYRCVVADVLGKFAPELAPRLRPSAMKGTPRY